MAAKKSQTIPITPKYELTAETKVFRGVPGREVVLHRIRALRDIKTGLLNEGATDDEKLLLVIHEGELGGWVESEVNLSQEGNSWIADDAYVTGDALVTGNAYVGGKAWVAGNSIVADDATVGGKAQLHNHAIACVCASVRGNAILQGDTIVAGYGVIDNDAWIFGNTHVRGSVLVDGHTRINGGEFVKQDDVPKWYPARARRKHRYALC